MIKTPMTKISEFHRVLQFGRSGMLGSFNNYAPTVANCKATFKREFAWVIFMELRKGIRVIWS
jgi:hypothetical protein